MSPFRYNDVQVCVHVFLQDFLIDKEYTYVVCIPVEREI